MKIQYIPPHELKNWWGFVKEGVEAILIKSHEAYIQEEIFAHLWAQKSMLWVFIDDDPQGFTILTPENDNLLIWAIWGKEPQSPEALEECFEMIKDIARKANAKTMTFGSHRLGWDKVARKLGFTPRLWEIEV